MRDDSQIENHMKDLMHQVRGGNEGPYYVACFNTALTFVDEPDGAYSVVRFCEYREPVEDGHLDEARAKVELMNQSGGLCPVCGKSPKFAICTDEDFEDRRSFCKRDPQKLRR